MFTKYVLRRYAWKDRQDNGKDKREKGQAIACKTLHRKLKIEQHETD